MKCAARKPLRGRGKCPLPQQPLRRFRLELQEGTKRNGIQRAVDLLKGLINELLKRFIDELLSGSGAAMRAVRMIMHLMVIMLKGVDNR